jgi:hypothetical protein
MQPKLEKIGLDWATFQVLRKTNASLSKKYGVDPKVAADQRGSRHRRQHGGVHEFRHRAEASRSEQTRKPRCFEKRQSRNAGQPEWTGP